MNRIFLLLPGLLLSMHAWAFSQSLHQGATLPQLPVAPALTAFRGDALSAREEGMRDAGRSSASGFAALRELTGTMRSIRVPAEKPRGARQPGDTLVIGPGRDSLLVSGTWTHAGPILVLGEGRLIFDNAHATIYGNIVVWGERAALIAHRSTLAFPQEYFYQRSLIAAGGSSISFDHTTLDYGGLPHNLAVTDSASAEYRAVTNIGFTTCGLSNRARLLVDTCNETGEFIVDDSVRLDFRNAHTVLLWHVVDAGAAMHVSFPDGALVDRYAMNATTQGVAGIRFDVKLEHCSNVMWALMPKPGSDIDIAGSTLRAIGLWFTGSDSLDVAGLVNNVQHVLFTAPLKDRSLALENTFVQTWSLYAFERAVLSVKGCILGEIGTFGRSRMTCTNTMVDGTGGYLFASDTSTLLYGFSTATCNVRSERNGILIFAYSAMTNGAAAAIGNSILITAQSGMIDDPVALEGSIAWMAEIKTPAAARAGESVEVSGSAWIDRAASSALFEFRKYAVSYQKAGDVLWTRIADTVFVEVRNGPLVRWNTAGLEPGLYNVRVTVVSDAPGDFAVDAMKTINILPVMTTLAAVPRDKGFTLYPNPVTDQVTIAGPEGEAAISDVLGREVWRGRLHGETRINASAWLPGVYLLSSPQTAARLVKR